MYKISALRYLLPNLFMLIIAGTQLFVNVYEERIVFAVLFFVIILLFAVFTILFSVDMIFKKHRFIIVKIVEVDGRVIKVLKPNGKIRGIIMPRKAQYNFEIDQKLKLTLTRSTRQIIEIVLL